MCELELRDLMVAQFEPETECPLSECSRYKLPRSSSRFSSRFLVWLRREAGKRLNLSACNFALTGGAGDGGVTARNASVNTFSAYRITESATRSGVAFGSCLAKLASSSEFVGVSLDIGALGLLL